MRCETRKRILRSSGLLLAILALPALVRAQNPPQPKPPSTSGTRLGVDLFGGGWVGWPAAHDSFEALDLGPVTFEVGGGVRVTGIWRTLFAQVTSSYWSDSGERVFVDEDGNTFPLGIPLELKATYVDATVGVKNAVFTSSGRVSFLTYFGAGAGAVRYRESSPFAQPGDDLDKTEASYHVLGGVEVPIAGPLAVAVDGRYRFIPGVLGDDGLSGVLDEDSLGGFQLSVALRLGFGGPRYLAPVPPPRIPEKPQPVTPLDRLPQGVITESAPMFLLPDATRTPLRVLPAGTTVKILSEKGDWLEVEIADPQFGRRVGYVQRKFVQMQQVP